MSSDTKNVSQEGPILKNKPFITANLRLYVWSPDHLCQKSSRIRESQLVQSFLAFVLICSRKNSINIVARKEL